MSASPYDDFVAKLAASLDAQSFVRVTLSNYPAAKDKDPATIDAPLEKLQGRLIAGPNEEAPPKLQLVYTYPTNTVTKNVELTEAATVLGEHLVATAPLKAARLFTTAQDWVLEVGKNGGKVRVYKNKPTYTEVEVGTHDRQKKRRLVMVPVDAEEEEGGGGGGGGLSASAGRTHSFLHEYDILGPGGRPKAGMKDKFRQIEKFVEILASLVEKLPKKGVESGTLSLLDAGCGKGYLTFAAYEYLTSQGYTVRAKGVDVRRDVVDKANAVAGRLGYTEKGLTFAQGSIADVTTSGQQQPPQQYDIVVALHACDTATDDCLHLGVRTGAQIIMSSPCCHKEVRQEIKRAITKAPEGEQLGSSLFPILRHGILLERQAEIATESIRVLALQLRGYTAQVFEWINDEDTSENLMITATKPRDQRALTDKKAQELRQQLQGVMELFGLRTQHLVELLGEEAGRRG